MLYKHLSQIKDHRRSQGQRFDLKSLILVSIVATLSGAISYRQITYFAEERFGQLKKIFSLEWKKSPSYSTFRRIIIEIDCNELEAIFREFSKKMNDKIRNSNNLVQFIAIDGKALRKSFDNMKDKKFSQILSFFGHDTNIILAHKEIDDKTNEIPEFQNLIKELNISDVIFTADAMHIQKKL